MSDADRRTPMPDPDDFMGPHPASPGCRCQICRPEPSYDDLDRATIETVLRHGWQVISVSDDGACDCEHDHDDQVESGSPPFSYTVGLGHRADHPELLMAGLDRGLMHHALNDVAHRVLAGRRLAPGDVLEGVLGGVPVVVEQVSEVGLEEAVTWSGWFHRRRPDALMLVWPTTSGIFAWQPGAPPTLDERQPRAWREPTEHTGGVGVDPVWVLPVPADTRAFTCTHVLDLGASVLWAARQSHPERGEDWSIHCGEAGHDTEEMRVAHLAHLVRSAPSLRDLADLDLDHEAWRDDPDSPWHRAAIDPELPG